mmetsp:Transcript_56462/g.104541  ORF Transcript_56462/g.104541 Transcript_56462/m.104541 type:complete len:346 (-) Transcript_56462:62-1099(-)
MDSSVSPVRASSPSWGQTCLRTTLEAVERMEREDAGIYGLKPSDELAEAVAATASATASADFAILKEVTWVSQGLVELKKEVKDLSKKQSDLWSLYMDLKREQTSVKLDALDVKVEGMARTQRDVQMSESVITQLEEKLAALHGHVAALIQRQDDGRLAGMSVSENGLQGGWSLYNSRFDQLARQVAVDTDKQQVLHRTMSLTVATLENRLREVETTIRRQHLEIEGIRKVAAVSPDERQAWKVTLAKVHKDVEDLAARVARVVQSPMPIPLPREPVVLPASRAPTPTVAPLPLQPAAEVPMASATVYVEPAAAPAIVPEPYVDRYGIAPRLTFGGLQRWPGGAP